MLVLTKKAKQSIAVGGSSGFENLLKITVLEIRSRSVKLGFEVPAGVPVHRWEVWQQIQSIPAAECLDSPVFP